MSGKPNLYHAEQERWTRWNGGRCPVPAETEVVPWYQDIGRSRHTYTASQLNWSKRIHTDGKRLPGDIIGYLVVGEGE